MAGLYLRLTELPEGHLVDVDVHLAHGGLEHVLAVGARSGPERTHKCYRGSHVSSLVRTSSPKSTSSRVLVPSLYLKISSTRSLVEGLSLEGSTLCAVAELAPEDAPPAVVVTTVVALGSEPSVSISSYLPTTASKLPSRVSCKASDHNDIADEPLRQEFEIRGRS